MPYARQAGLVSAAEAVVTIDENTPANDPRDIDERPDPEAVWMALFDATVPAEYTRPIKVVALEEWFKPHTERLSDELCVRPGRHVECQPGNRSPKWILRAARGAVGGRGRGDARERLSRADFDGDRVWWFPFFIERERSNVPCRRRGRP